MIPPTPDYWASSYLESALLIDFAVPIVQLYVVDLEHDLVIWVKADHVTAAASLPAVVACSGVLLTTVLLATNISLTRGGLVDFFATRHLG
ncbi:hypothetical protein F4813DRAFT_342376 [Daldinia decipiens]|uniref:uncharacterized protein n=1 Tax=Daldinia decipiens TaxID=326647 RepID=UPI0020C465D9|nr:uncharacterized protein F4813DRAFT_342376 [Daldinia decipiens]KAI1662927.1 hypothetical protein F4813DRAFT_342376 [Daldinia decipiens]